MQIIFDSHLKKAQEDLDENTVEVIDTSSSRSQSVIEPSVPQKGINDTGLGVQHLLRSGLIGKHFKEKIEEQVRFEMTADFQKTLKEGITEQLEKERQKMKHEQRTMQATLEQSMKLEFQKTFESMKLHLESQLKDEQVRRQEAEDQAKKAFLSAAAASMGGAGDDEETMMQNAAASRMIEEQFETQKSKIEEQRKTFETEKLKL